MSMADQSPRPDSPLLSQLQATLDQLDTVVRQLDADPEQRQSLRDETFTRLQATLDSLQKMKGNLPDKSASGGATDNQTNQTSEWDEMFVESFPTKDTPSRKSRPQTSVAKAETERRSPSASPPNSPTKRVPRRQKPKFGILSAIATGLLGILVGILLWIGIPPLDLPPLWDQIASRIPPLPITQAADQPISPPDSSPDDSLEPQEEEAALPPVLEAPAPPTAIAIDPLPEAPLTPEQSLLSVIQQELVDLEGLYPPQLIQRIEPNFLASRLTLTIGANWDQLSAKQQQTLLDALWQRAQKLSFVQLRLYAPDGDLIARSPVVGQQMVVLQSSDALTE